jgi:hypothetical protein
MAHHGAAPGLTVGCSHQGGYACPNHSHPAQTLAASDLDKWLDDLQNNVTRPAGPNCHVTLIVDACYSGSP